MSKLDVSKITKGEAVNWHDYFTYDANTGNLVWKRRHRTHFKSESAMNRWNNYMAGRVAGCARNRRDKNGPVVVDVNGRCVQTHRIIWEMHHGLIPEGMQIDHIDVNPRNNRVCNLRLASNAENARNRFAHKANKSGYKGVHWNKQDSKWMAAICIGGGRRIYLGRFDDPVKAHEAYSNAATLYHGEFKPKPSKKK